MARGIFAPVNNNETINYITIESAGNASDFGDFFNYNQVAICSNGTNDRGLIAGGINVTTNDNIQYVTISTTGNSTNFGDLTQGRFALTGVSNLTLERGLFLGGLSGATPFNIIDYVTINTTGNATNFGSLRQVLYYSGAASSKGKAFIGGGATTGSVFTDDIDVLTISNLDNSVLFGNLTSTRTYVAGTSNDTNERIVFAGGAESGGPVNVIDYITASTWGNATDFGDQSVTRQQVGATSNGSSNRGVFGGGLSGASPTNVIDYITISTTGNASDFGDLTHASEDVAACSNAGAGTGTIATALNKWMNILETNIPKMLGVDRATTQLSKLMGLTLTDYVSVVLGDRGVFGSGFSTAPANINIIDYITISTTGNATDFGDLAAAKRLACSTSNGGNDRGVFGGGYTNTQINVIEYITILTTGNATDFGDMTTARYGSGGLSNRTSNRGVFGGGQAAAASNVIDYITISTTGNATDFGDLIRAKEILNATSSNNTRGLFYGGWYSASTPYRVNEIDYITIASTGNASDFGDLSTTASYGAGTDNGTNDRGVFQTAVVGTSSTITNVIEYITISTTGNSSDFGDLATSRAHLGGSSNKENNRGLFSCGITVLGTANAINTIEYITITTTGNATDFGDTTTARYLGSSTSNS